MTEAMRTEALNEAVKVLLDLDRVNSANAIQPKWQDILLMERALSPPEERTADAYRARLLGILSLYEMDKARSKQSGLITDARAKLEDIAKMARKLASIADTQADDQWRLILSAHEDDYSKSEESRRVAQFFRHRLKLRSRMLHQGDKRFETPFGHDLAIFATMADRAQAYLKHHTKSQRSLAELFDARVEWSLIFRSAMLFRILGLPVVRTISKKANNFNTFVSHMRDAAEGTITSRDSSNQIRSHNKAHAAYVISADALFGALHSVGLRPEKAMLHSDRSAEQAVARSVQTELDMFMQNGRKGLIGRRPDLLGPLADRFIEQHAKVEGVPVSMSRFMPPK